MSTLSLRLPIDPPACKALGGGGGRSVNQLISLAVAEELSAIDTERYLSSRASKGDEAKFRRVMSKVSAGVPEPGDEIVKAKKG